MCVPFLAAAGLLKVPPLAGFWSRLARVCAWSDTYPLQRRAQRFDAAALRNLFFGNGRFRGCHRDGEVRLRPWS